MNTPSVSQLFDLSGKVAVVTGGGQGIGKGIAVRLAEAGAAVLVADINMPAAAQTAQELKSLGHRVAAIQSDAGSVSDAVRVAGAAVEQFGSLDILVNNAGIFPFASFLEVNEALWDKVMTVNLKGVFFYSQAAAKAMIQGGRGGKIVNIASIDAFRPMGNLSHYDISKAGVVMLTKSLAIELGRHGININVIAPGGVHTPGGEQSWGEKLKTLGLTLEQLQAEASAFLARIPLGRVGVPDDIARAALFLSSPAGDYLTGSVLVVDGGVSNV